MFRVFFIILFFSLSHSGFAMKRPTFPLQDKLKAPLVSLLDDAVYLHQAFYSKEEGQIHLALSRMINQIETLEQTPELLPYHQRSYTYRVLRGLKLQLEAMTGMTNGKRKNNINSINRTLTYMAHVYGLKKHAVFFCPRDRSVWMQGKNVKKRPLHLEYQSCGAVVGN